MTDPRIPVTLQTVCSLAGKPAARNTLPRDASTGQIACTLTDGAATRQADTLIEAGRRNATPMAGIGPWAQRAGEPAPETIAP